jgi:peptide/nickel transport system substrate-binding protein
VSKLIALALVGALMAAAGCQQAPAGPPPTEPPLPGTLMTVIIPLPTDPAGFNAYLSDTGYEELLGELVYEGLAEMAPDGSFYARLAQELPTLQNGGISPDGLTVTWKLRDHVVWSDGQPFTSDDVLFTYEALHHPNNKLARDTGVDLIDSVETPDDYTVILRYREPYANVWGQFGGRGLGIFPRHACGDLGWMPGWECNTRPVGTGPFVLDTWDEGKQVVMARNTRYWQTERPFLDRIVFPIVRDGIERADMLADGDVHANLWLTPEQSKYLEDVPDLRRVTLPSRWLLRIVFNLDEPPPPSPDSTPTPGKRQRATPTPGPPGPNPALAAPRVRQALDLAIDRQRVIDEVFTGRAQPAASEFFRGWTACPELGETIYDPNAARALLAEAGWLDLDGNGTLEAHGVPNVPDDTPLRIRLTAPDSWEALIKAQKLIAKMWQEVGAKVQTEIVGPRDLQGDWEEQGMEVRSKFEVDVWDDGYPGTDPTDYLIWRYASWAAPSQRNNGQGGNVMRYSDPEVDRLLQHALTQIDPRERHGTLCQVGRILAEQRPMLYLAYFTETHALSPRVQNAVINPNDALTWDAFNWQISR